MDKNQNISSYWKENLKLLALLLMIWFSVSFLAGILFVDALNSISFSGFKLGFWFAQQGSIYTFVVLIFYYAHRMKALDKKYGLDSDDNGGNE